jgi:broad-specificity NMP kinase
MSDKVKVSLEDLIHWMDAFDIPAKKDFDLIEDEIRMRAVSAQLKRLAKLDASKSPLPDSALSKVREKAKVLIELLDENVDILKADLERLSALLDQPQDQRIKMEVREMTKAEIIEAKTQHIKNHLDRITQLETENKRLRECLSEAIDLVESVRTGEYKPDSFTTQPWKKALSGGGSE